MARLHLGRGRVLALAALIILISGGIATQASNKVTQVWMPGPDIFNQWAFQQDLPVFGPVGPGNPAVLPRVNAVQHSFLKVRMVEIEQQVFPVSSGIGKTRVWAYEISDARTGQILGPAHWPAVTVEAQRFIPTIMKYVNELPSFGDPIVIDGISTTAMVQGLITTDPSIHWANPLGNTGPMNCMDPIMGPCAEPYLGPVPAVVHLHGGETLSDYDGGPEQWWTPNGLIGKDFRTLGARTPGTAVYKYDNMQEPGTLWFHDHALGATRTNVYSGLATFYFLRSPLSEPRNLPNGPYEIEMAFQDRQFDTNGQLYFPDGSGDPASNLNGVPPNPTVNAFWIPEFIGDTWTVNGAIWPKLAVEPRRYRFRLLGGSNARMVNLTFGSAPVYVIGHDANYLDKPVQVSSVFITPGQRMDVIVDFTGMAGQSFVVMNDAMVPYPMGFQPGVDQPGMDQVMRIDVTRPLRGTDRSANPATGGARLPFYDQSVKLTDGNGHLAPGVQIDKVRQLVLKEFNPGAGPEMVLLQNTHWDGLMSGNIQPYFPVDGVSEMPQVGATEIWEFINLTMDAHPMHTHLFQFQVLSRQPYNQTYLADWGAAFPGMTNPDPTNPMPGWGPPLAYDRGETTVINGKTVKVVGGNPRIEPYLDPVNFPAVPPPAWDSGWHDTAIAYPFQVTRIVVRVAPTWAPLWFAKPGRNLFPFDPTMGPGYVWHCHIVDHEDNEMMRPMKIKKISQ